MNEEVKASNSKTPVGNPDDDCAAGANHSRENNLLVRLLKTGKDEEVMFEESASPSDGTQRRDQTGGDHDGSHDYSSGR